MTFFCGRARASYADAPQACPFTRESCSICELTLINFSSCCLPNKKGTHTHIKKLWLYAVISHAAYSTRYKKKRKAPSKVNRWSPQLSITFPCPDFGRRAVSFGLPGIRLNQLFIGPGSGPEWPNPNFCVYCAARSIYRARNPIECEMFGFGCIISIPNSFKFIHFGCWIDSTEIETMEI